MAVGKGSMARASKAADNTSVSKETKRTTAKTTAKTKAVTASKVISGTSKEVMQMIEHQKSDQVLDREPEENELIEGIPVVSKIDTLTEYIQTRWVDALLVGIKKKTLIPEDLFDTCVNMGITVHECLEDRAGWAGNQFINRMGGYTVLTSSCLLYTSPSPRDTR